MVQNPIDSILFELNVRKFEVRIINFEIKPVVNLKDNLVLRFEVKDNCDGVKIYF